MECGDFDGDWGGMEEAAAHAGEEEVEVFFGVMHVLSWMLGVH